MEMRPEDTEQIPEWARDWAHKYIRVGTQYYKKSGDELLKWNRDTIIYDEGLPKSDASKRPELVVKKYDAFTDEPAHGEDYRECVDQRYNRYHPLPYDPVEGDFPTILAFLKHIFGGKATVENPIEGDPFTIGLDYFTILWQMPRQILPILALVSERQGTGKTTFLRLLKMVFSKNVIILGNEQSQGRFNSHMAGKLVVAIDEAVSQANRHERAESIKQMSTSTTLATEGKGQDVVERNSFMKFVMCSNNVTNFIQIDENETRYWVLELGPIRTDPTAEERMQAEAPAFAHFLKHREIVHPRTNRAWFDPDFFQNDALRRVVEETRPLYEREILGFVDELFSRSGDLSEIRMTPTDMVNLMRLNGYERVKRVDICRFLKSKKKMNTEGLMRYDAPMLSPGQALNFISSVGRPYVFRRRNWSDEISNTNQVQINSFHNGTIESVPF